MTNTNDEHTHLEHSRSEHIYIVMKHVVMYEDAHSFPVGAFSRYEDASKFVADRQVEDDKWRGKANRIISEWVGRNYRVTDIIIEMDHGYGAYSIEGVSLDTGVPVRTSSNKVERVWME